jgi:6-phosphogluconolactonase (cycloisomerase 2 family)
LARPRRARAAEQIGAARAEHGNNMTAGASMSIRPSPKLAFYGSAGATLTHYDVDVDAAILTRRETIRLPEMVQYVWPHASRRFLYVASSSRGPGMGGNEHHLSALKVDPATGALSPQGQRVVLPARPIHVTTDLDSRYVLTAYNEPSSLTVHRINADGSLGEEVEQTPLDCGIYAHQVRVMPSNRSVILVARGNRAANGKPEEPGALKVFDFRDGKLSLRQSVAPNGGFGFGPRHLDFHPSNSLLYVSIETQNEICVFRMNGDTIDQEPLWRKTTLTDPAIKRGRQVACTIHFHPDGRTAYIPNRAYGFTAIDGRQVADGGENNMAVFAIDPATGEPARVQNIDTAGFGTRTFSIDPSGRLLIAGNLMSLDVREGAGYRKVPTTIALFRVGTDGRLAFARKYDIETGADTQFWTGMITLPQ